ncbi:MAG: DNA polymerase III subunit beta [Patescibacteria group bacterium]|nr:MAG: DNA polymerase III subunit beta [Patescibacteria group bacterium]
MKAKVIQEDLKKAIIAASRFSSSRPQIPVLSNILLKTDKSKISVSATNLEMSINFEVGAKIEEEGEITVPSKTLLEIVNNLNPGVIDLDLEKETLTIKSENFKSKLLGINASEFPKIPTSIKGKSIKVPFGLLVKSLSNVIFSSSYDETKPVLTGILLFVKNKKLNLVATDGYRLSLSTVEGKYDFDFEKIIIPKFIFNEIPRFVDNEELTFSYDLENNLVLFKTKEAVLSSRIIEGNYPDFQKIIPNNSKTKVIVDKEDFLRLVKLASIFARDSANVVKISTENGILTILAESQYSGSQKSSVEAKIEGEDIKIAFNYKFLEDFLNSVSGDTVLMEFNDSFSPVVFRDTADKNYLHLIMPVKI